MGRNKKSATTESKRNRLEASMRPCSPAEASAIINSEILPCAAGISIVVYQCDPVTLGDKPWRADIVVQGMPGTTTVDGFSRKAVVDESKAAAAAMIQLRTHWAREAVKIEPRAEAETEIQLTLL